MLEIAGGDPDRAWDYRVSFASVRTPGITVVMDPRKPGSSYRRGVETLSMTASAWRH
jgi:hypothetical protein